MSWCPFATRMELQPESDAQPEIVPDQFIVHSIVAPWTPRRTYEYWRDSSSLESHFGLGYDGDLAQYIGTQTRADANAAANRRPNGHGAVSMETASNTSASDPWTPAQADKIVAVGVWLHQEHNVPLRICRTWDDPGYGYHRMFPEWSTSGTACPGNARVQQWHDEIFPRIKNGDTMSLTTTQASQLAELHGTLVPYAGWAYKGKDETRDAYAYLRGTNADVKALTAKVAALTVKVDGLGSVNLTDAQLSALADKIAASPGLAESIARLVAQELADRIAE